MTFKVKNGLAVGSITVVDQNSYFQQTESVSSVAPSLVLDFTSKSLDRRITFTRASNATYVSATGLIQNAVTNEARFTHDPSTRQCQGILPEETKANYLLWSANTLGGGWFADQAYLQSTSIAAPDGSLTTAKLNEGTSSAGYRIIRQELPGSVTANTKFTVSIYAKAAETAYANVNLAWFDSSGTGQYAYANFNISTGTMLSFNEGYANGFNSPSLANADIIPCSNGWYRCCLTFTTGANTGGSIRVGMNYFTSPGGNSNGFYVWGGQLETGHYPTSFIYTTTAIATRAADSVSINTANLFSWYNQSEGTTHVRFYNNRANFPVDVYPSVFFYGGAPGNQISIYGNGNGGTDRITNYGLVYNNIQQHGYTDVPNVKGLNNVAWATGPNSSYFTGNGGDAAPDTTVQMPYITYLTIGIGWNNPISSFVYYPKRLSNTAVYDLTAT